jgi:hypothetical protein
MPSRASSRAKVWLVALLIAGIAGALLYRPISRALSGSRKYDLKPLSSADESRVRRGVSELVSVFNEAPRTEVVLAKTSLPPAGHWEGRVWVHEDARQVFRKVTEVVAPSSSASYGDRIYSDKAGLEPLAYAVESLPDGTALVLVTGPSRSLPE